MIKENFTVIFSEIPLQTLYLLTDDPMTTKIITLINLII